jgi:hypothetical protein
MKCFARWEIDEKSGVFFRDQTILQFGNSWDLLANFILLNPGSALPLNSEDQTAYLESKGLPFFVKPQSEEKYVEFSIDRLMNDLFRLFSTKKDGGTIRLYNLFNLKNQHSSDAVFEFDAHMGLQKMFAKDSEIAFYNAPVVIASGSNAVHNPRLKQELLRYIALAKPENLYKLSKVERRLFSILKVNTYGDELLVDSYHPSYTCKYGNTTTLGDLIFFETESITPLVKYSPTHATSG